jgi:hypothetical protein
VVKKHVMDPNCPDYHSDCEFDVPRRIIEYDHQDFPFAQDDCIDTLLPRTNEYKEKLVEFQGKGSRSIKILKKKKIRKIKSENKLFKVWSRQNHLQNLTLKTYLMLTLVKEALHSCGIRRRESPSMLKGINFYGLVLTSSRRSPRREHITYLPLMGEGFHY